MSKPAEKLPQPVEGSGQVVILGGFRRRPSLGTARGIRRELAAVYLELRRGDIDIETAKASGFILRCMLEALRVDELEKRIDALETVK